MKLLLLAPVALVVVLVVALRYCSVGRPASMRIRARIWGALLEVEVEHRHQLSVRPDGRHRAGRS